MSATPPDDAFTRLSAAYVDPRRLELYLARIAVDHGRRALTALRGDDVPVFEAELRAYGRIAHGLIASGYWLPDAESQIGWGVS